MKWDVALITALTLFTAMPGHAHVPSKLLDTLTGCYYIPSPRCSLFGAKGDLEPCGPEFTDCLTIQKVSQSTAKIDVSSAKPIFMNAGSLGSRI